MFNINNTYGNAQDNTQTIDEQNRDAAPFQQLNPMEKKQIDLDLHHGNTTTQSHNDYIDTAVMNSSYKFTKTLSAIFSNSSHNQPTNSTVTSLSHGWDSERFGGGNNDGNDDHRKAY
eukprot:53081_1